MFDSRDIKECIAGHCRTLIPIFVVIYFVAHKFFFEILVTENVKTFQGFRTAFKKAFVIFKDIIA